MTPETGPTELRRVPPAAEREQVVARLTQSFARDELSLDEFERRVAVAYNAATTEALAALTADLPSSTAAVPLTAALPLRVDAVLSNVQRGGNVAVPPELEVRAWAGNVELDLRGAQLAPGVTEIALHNVMGNIEIQLPMGVQVENHGSMFLGSFECRDQRNAEKSRASAVPTSVVRFTGRTVLGSVSVTLT